MAEVVWHYEAWQIIAGAVVIVAGTFLTCP